MNMSYDAVAFDQHHYYNWTTDVSLSGNMKCMIGTVDMTVIALPVKAGSILFPEIILLNV